MLSFLSFFVRRVLDDDIDELWDEIWEKIFTLVIEAENKWDEKNRGKEKKKWVVEKVMKYIKQKVEPNWIKRQIINLFISRVVDRLVNTLNEELGKDWIEQAEELEEDWHKEIFG